MTAAPEMVPLLVIPLLPLKNIGVVDHDSADVVDEDSFIHTKNKPSTMTSSPLLKAPAITTARRHAC